MSNQVLIIDDEEKLRSLLAKIIQLEGFEVVQAPDCKTGLRKLQQSEFDIVLCDVKLPDGNGVDFVSVIKNKFPNLEIILLTAYGTIADGVSAIKNGAFDYITKGDDNNKIIPLLHRAMDKVSLAKKVNKLDKETDKSYSFESIIGKSKAIQHAIELSKKVASTDASVLLTGETGTGKEVFAQAIHRAGNRKDRNFVAINCSAISRDLMESELFGHKAGAFTGAIKDKPGLFQEAENGTVFLDEIGEMPLELQAKLLRVLETGDVFRVGDTKSEKVNVRIIAATNRDLQKEIEAGSFRADLFYRISVFQVHLPALRNRREDIPDLAHTFMFRFAGKCNKQITGIDQKAQNILVNYNWNGNIRELKNIMERAVILAEGTQITAEDLPAELQIFPSTESPAFNLEEIEKRHIRSVFEFTGHNKTKTADLLGIAITTLYRKLDEYNIR